MPFPKSIYFYEDDYCQIEVLPLSLWQYCFDEMKKIDEFSETYKTDFGWSEIYIREELPKSLSDFSISLAVFKDKIEKTLTAYDKVLTGYSSYMEECKSSFAWGLPDKDLTIFADINSENEINNIWLDIGCIEETNLQTVLSTFNNLPNSQDLMIADWKWSKIVKIDDEQQLQDYLLLHNC